MPAIVRLGESKIGDRIRLLALCALEGNELRVDEALDGKCAVARRASVYKIVAGSVRRDSEYYVPHTRLVEPRLDHVSRPVHDDLASADLARDDEGLLHVVRPE